MDHSGPSIIIKDPHLGSACSKFAVSKFPNHEKCLVKSELLALSLDNGTTESLYSFLGVTTFVNLLLSRLAHARLFFRRAVIVLLSFTILSKALLIPGLRILCEFHTNAATQMVVDPDLAHLGLLRFLLLSLILGV